MVAVSLEGWVALLEQEVLELKRSLPRPASIPWGYHVALQLAAAAHAGQTVPSTPLPYLFHVTLVAVEVLAAVQAEPGHDGNLALQCVLLQNVVEDTAVTAEALEASFGPAVAACVLALSKNLALLSDEQIPDSLRRIQEQPRELWMIKLADRIVNLQPPPAHWQPARIAAYKVEAQRSLPSSARLVLRSQHAWPRR